MLRRLPGADIVVAVNEAIERVVTLLPVSVGHVPVVAIDGHSATGKSTFASLLASRLSAAVVRGDDFYRVINETHRAMLSPAQGASQYYDWQRMRVEALFPLRVGLQARYRPYDWDRNQLARKTTMVSPAGAVVVEGLFVSRPELADLVDVAILMTADAEVRAQRQRKRADASDEWLQRWEQAELWYFTHVRPIATFDVVVDTS